MRTPIDASEGRTLEPFLFREPGLHRALRDKVVPFLRTYPFVDIWQPGCGSGADAYATAILLREERLHRRARIYATDSDETLLDHARQAAYPLAMLQGEALRYHESGGTSALAEYYVVSADRVILRPLLSEPITFFLHDLTTDASFNRFQLVLCRVAMSELAPRFEERAFDLVHASLCPLGVLGLAPGDSLRHHRHRTCYEEIDSRARLYRRVC